jgi:hypothetical protein
MKVKSGTFGKKLKIFNSEGKKEGETEPVQQQHPPLHKNFLNRKR